MRLAARALRTGFGSFGRDTMTYLLPVSTWRASSTAFMPFSMEDAGGFTLLLA